MATYSRVKTFVANETLTASDLNTEFNNIITNTNSGNLNSDNVSTSAAWTWTGYHTYSTSSRIVLADNIYMTLGNATDGDYRLRYNSSSTALELTSTNSDGSGTDAVVMDVQDGTDDVRIRGGLSTNNNAAPTSGIVTGGNIVSDTDGTDDLGTTSVRWANLYVDAATITNNLTVGGTLTLTGGLTLNGNVTVGDNASDTLTINSTITSNLIFTDNTYDIGASGATRPRDLFLSRNAVMGGTLGVTGLITASGGVSGTTGTFSGDLAVDGDTLFVDVSADKVSINAGTTPQSTLHIQNTGTNAYAIEVDASDGGNLWGVFEDSGGAGQSYLRDASGNPKVVLNSVGDSYFTGGQVGIGTSSAEYPLDVDTAGGTSYVAHFRNTTTTSPYTVFIEEPTSAQSSSPLLYVGTASRPDFRIDSAGRRIGMGVSPNVDMHSNNSLYLQMPNNVFRWTRSDGSYYSSNVYYNLSDQPTFAANGYGLQQTQNTSTGAYYWAITTASNSSGAGQGATLATKMFLNSTGAGLGTVSPLAVLHTATGTANLSSVAGSTQAVFEHTAAAGSVSRVAIIGGSGSGYSVLDFGDTSGSNNGGITYNHGDDSMSFATTNGTTKMSIQSGTEVWIANTSDQGAYNLQVGGTGVWGAGAYVNGSDEKIKQSIATYDDDATELVSQMRPVTFEYTEEYSRDRATQVGFIAQDLQQVLEGKDYADGIVKEDANQLNVAYQSIIPILTKAIQELTQRVKELESN